MPADPRTDFVSERQRRALPLADLPPDMRSRIEAAVASPLPPPRTLERAHVRMQSRAWWEWHWQRGIDPDRRRLSLSPTLRAAVIARDGYVCQLCGADVGPDDVHIDHVYPRSRGGRDVLANLQVAHALCNLRKGARL